MMKPNKLTQNANLRWERSDIILPDQNDIKRRRPELTKEEQQELFVRLSASRSSCVDVTITLFGVYENRHITGTVTGLDPRLHLIKVETTGTYWDWHLIDFADVIGVEFET
jgi:hypothetical protein